MTTYSVQLATNPQALAKLASQEICFYLKQALEKKERIQIALSGGNTPADTYKLLANESLDWERVDVFLADERWVDPESELSNTLMITKTLLGSGPGKKARIHRLPTTELATPQETAKAFSEMLKKICRGNPPFFDLIVLGIGSDGHTASLFPETESLKINDCPTAVSIGNGIERITLTHPVLSSAGKVIFLVSGAQKNLALKRLIDPTESPFRTPARLVSPSSDVLILADKEAGDGLGF